MFQIPRETSRMTEFEDFFPIIKGEIFKKHESRVESNRARTIGIMAVPDLELMVPKNLRYFKNPSPEKYPLNLNLGYDDYKIRPEQYYRLHLSKLEKFLMKNDGRSLLKNKEKQQICTSRNVLKLLMAMPYRLNRSKLMELNRFEDWSIKAIKFGNVIYLSKIKESRTVKSPHETYHFKFQQYCFADSPYKNPNIDEPIDENDQVSCVFEATLDDFDILYTAEIMGVESKYPIKYFKNPSILDKRRFVSTKLLLEKDNTGRYNWKTHPKLLLWWIQAYLGRVDNIYVGFKSFDGFVKKPVERVDVRDLPKNQKWKPEICKRFLCEFLKKVQNIMHNVDNPCTTYEFKYYSALQMIKYRIFENKEEFFLSEDFIQYMQM